VYNIGAEVFMIAAPPNSDNKAAPLAVTTVFKGNLSFNLNCGCE
jgi:hypothetical protein